MANEYLDLRDLSKELDDLRDRAGEDEEGKSSLDEDEIARLAELEALDKELNDLESYASDEPSAIRDDYFEDAMRDLAQDCGYTKDDNPLMNYIDWASWASDCQADYTSFDFDGSTWWVRSI